MKQVFCLYCSCSFEPESGGQEYCMPSHRRKHESYDDIEIIPVAFDPPVIEYQPKKEPVIKRIKRDKRYNFHAHLAAAMADQEWNAKAKEIELRLAAKYRKVIHGQS